MVPVFFFIYILLTSYFWIWKCYSTYWGMKLTKLYCSIVCMNEYLTMNPAIMYNYNAYI